MSCILNSIPWGNIETTLQLIKLHVVKFISLVIYYSEKQRI